jgi:Uma2 family endonuclease
MVSIPPEEYLHAQNAISVRIPNRRGFAYPDLTIVCRDRVFFDAVRDVLMNPLVIFEVLSEGTRSFDLAAKFREYQRLESLRHYVVVEQDVRAVMHYERAADGRWVYEALTGPEDVLRLTAAAGIQLPLAEIYEGVSLRTVDA